MEGPAGGLQYTIFLAIDNTIGKFIFVDNITSKKERFDFARLLVNIMTLLIEQQVMNVNIEGTIHQILVKKEISVYQDWTGLQHQLKERKESMISSDVKLDLGDGDEKGSQGGESGRCQ